MVTKPNLPLPPKVNGLPAAANPNESSVQGEKRYAIVGGKIDGPQRILLYGPGGIGKSTLAALAPNPVFLDVENGTNEIDVPRVEGLSGFRDLRVCLQSNALDGFSTIVLDSATRAEEWAIAHTLATVKAEKGATVTSIESYGFGKGYQHVFDTFLLLLADLDKRVRKGQHVILIAHDCITTVPNPMSEDFIRFEPHLQGPRSGRASIRNRVVQWCDHVLFVGYDVLAKEGKGIGAGTRTIYSSELPTHIAKSRRISSNIAFSNASDGSIWNSIFGGK